MTKERAAGSTTATGGRPAATDGRRRPYEGPVEWLFTRLEETYTRLGPKDTVEPALQSPVLSAAHSSAGLAVAAAADTIRHDERLIDGKLEAVPRNYWEDVLAAYHRRRLETEAPGLATAPAILPGMPAIPGQNNWTPLGPSVVARGQTGNRAPVVGRTSGIAVAPDGLRVSGTWGMADFRAITRG
ncbi:hypothetical protein QFZ65_002437 [Arthrobacter sp. B3I9]|uniref:hypothetical protein n=1 Tax=Arthrobacter sp. B3I9 TaxID=3042270 RepID=UPI00278E0124|nr:hypothetical protein [Arthrobacter sp. B3I9]MDQ0850499.1 hypothetical protein [Arthrobacter sp. B3I9]